MVGIRYDQYAGSIGGGTDFPDPVTKDNADIFVSSWSDLEAAASNAVDGDVIYVENGSEIYWTDNTPVTFNQDNLTLASGRHDSFQGRIICDDWKNQGISYEQEMIVFNGDNITVTGLEIDGQVPPGADPNYGDNSPRPQAIAFYGTGFTVENCIFTGWAGAVRVRLKEPNATVRYNLFDENAMGGLGYGVAFGYNGFTSESGGTIIEYNVSDGDRHFISGAESRYEARDNRIDHQTSHIMNVRARPQGIGEPCGNGYVHHNECHTDNRLMAVRGVPSDNLHIAHNYTEDGSEPQANDGYVGSDGVVVQPYSDKAPEFSNVTFDGNQWGGDPPERDTEEEEEEEEGGDIHYNTEFRIGYPEDDWLHYDIIIESDVYPYALTDNDSEYFSSSSYEITELENNKYQIAGRTGTADPSGPMYGDGFDWNAFNRYGFENIEVDAPDESLIYYEINGTEYTLEELRGELNLDDNTALNRILDQLIEINKKIS